MKSFYQFYQEIVAQQGVQPQQQQQPMSGQQTNMSPQQMQDLQNRAKILANPVVAKALADLEKSPDKNVKTAAQNLRTATATPVAGQPTTQMQPQQFGATTTQPVTPAAPVAAQTQYQK